MPDYRNRQPVDAPVYIVFSRRKAAWFVGAAMFSLASWYGVAVALGLAFR